MIVDREPFSLRLLTPLSTASGRIERREGVAVRLRDRGVSGVGEAAPLPGWTESLESCRTGIESVASPRRSLEDGSLDRRPAARHAIALALSDIDAKRRGDPLYRSFGGRTGVTAVPVTRTIGHASVDETVERARVAVAEGYGTIKLKVGVDSPERDRQRVEAVRRAIGDERAIRLDANESWDRETARRALGRFESYDVEFVEQPLPRNDLGGVKTLDSPIDIALDESFVGRTVDGVSDIIDAADVVICKPMVLGGLDRARALAGMAADRGTPAVVTTTVDGVVARTAAVHLAAAVEPNRVHGLATAGLLAEDPGHDPAPIADGRIEVPQSPGLGTEGPWGDRNG